MGQYTQLPSNAFTELQMDSGILCLNFDPATGAYSNIIGSTTGGIKISATPNYEDRGAEVDNCANNTMEAKKLTYWDTLVEGTQLSTNASALTSLIGAADVSGTHITLNNSLSASDFQTIWFVGDYGSAGFLAVKLSNALNVNGLSLTTSKNKSGQFGFKYQGHYNMTSPDTVPLDIYIDNSVTTHDVTYILTHATTKVSPLFVADGADLIVQVAATTNHTLPTTITVKVGGSALIENTGYTWDETDGLIFVRGLATTGAVEITVTATT